jgi:hypothetical protein
VLEFLQHHVPTVYDENDSSELPKFASIQEILQTEIVRRKELLKTALSSALKRNKEHFRDNDKIDLPTEFAEALSELHSFQAQLKAKYENLITLEQVDALIQRTGNNLVKASQH